MEEYWENLSFAGKAKFIISVVIGTLTIVLATLNWTEIQVHLIFWKPTIPLSLIILGSIVGGYAISYVFAYRKFKSKDNELDQLKSQTSRVQELESQVKSLQQQVEQLKIVSENDVEPS